MERKASGPAPENQAVMRLDTRTWALIPLAVAINVAAGSIASYFRLPLYLDSLGTILVASLAGPAAGALTGAVSNTVIPALSNPVWLAFVPVAAAVGALAGWLARRGFLGSPLTAAMAGLLVGVVAATLSAPVSAWLFGGTTGGGTDMVVAVFRAMGMNRLEASIAQGLVTDPLDKMLSFLMVQSILAALPHRLRSAFPQGEMLGRMRSFALPGLRGGGLQHGERRAVVLAGSPSGLYRSMDGILHRTAPLTKILLVGACAAAAVTLPAVVAMPDGSRLPAPALPLLATALLGLALIGGIGLELGRTSATLALPLVLSMVAVNGLFGGAASAAWGPFRWSTPAALEALGLGLRVFLILESVVLLLLTTRPDLLMGDLERRGLPHRLAYVLLASLNLVPTMLRRAGEILEAQTSRGMPLGQGVLGRARALIPMSGPLLLGAVSEVEERALALEARGFGSENQRTWWSDPPRTTWDPTLQVLLVLTILMLGGRLFL